MTAAAPADALPHPPGHLDACQQPSRLTGQLAATATRLVADALATDGLRRQHYTVLSALGEQGAVSQAALGRRVWIDRSDMHALLNDLERDGFVTGVRDENDRRRMLIDLTLPGARALKRLDKRVQAAQEELIEPLSVADRREFRRLLTRLVEHHSGRQSA